MRWGSWWRSCYHLAAHHQRYPFQSFHICWRYMAWEQLIRKMNPVNSRQIVTCAFIIPLPLCIQFIELHSSSCVSHLDLIQLSPPSALFSPSFRSHLHPQEGAAAVGLLPCSLSSSSTVRHSLPHFQASGLWYKTEAGTDLQESKRVLANDQNLKSWSRWHCCLSCSH